MLTRKSLLAAVFLAASCSLLATTGSAKPFPGYTWREFQDGQGLAGPGYTRFGEVSGRLVRPPFERALAGEPRAVAAFFDVKLKTDGEHSFTHQRMALLLLASLGDRRFCRHLSRRAPLVQWRVSSGLCSESENPDFRPVFQSRFPRTLALARRWERVPFDEVSRRSSTGGLTRRLSERLMRATLVPLATPPGRMSRRSACIR